MSRPRERGQAAVELVAVAPLLVLALLGLAQLVLALRADLAAGRAAERGLAAAYAGGDVRGAALAGLGEGASARVERGVLRVEVRRTALLPLPGLGPARAAVTLP